MFACKRRCVVALALTAPLVTAMPSEESVAALPDIESVLLKAKGKANDFAAQAQAMQARVEEEQAKSRATLKAAKEEYEHKLTEQADKNAKIERDNSDLLHDIRHLEQENKRVQEEAEAISSANDAMRKSLNAMQSKVQAAELFVKDSLEKTDDSTAQELTVLEPTTPKPTLDHFLSVAQATADLSFMQLSAERQSRAGGSPQRAQDLVQLLAGSLADISSAEKEGAAQMKAKYLESFASGQKRTEELMSIQTSLLERKAEVNTTQTKLIVARDHIKDTFTQLEKRLHGLRVFARKVDTMAASALKEGLSQDSSATSLLVDKVDSVQQTQFPWLSWSHGSTTSTTTATRTTTITTTPRAASGSTVTKETSPAKAAIESAADRTDRKVSTEREKQSANKTDEALKPTLSKKAAGKNEDKHMMDSKVATSTKNSVDTKTATATAHANRGGEKVENKSAKSKKGVAKKSAAPEPKSARTSKQAVTSTGPMKEAEEKRRKNVALVQSDSTADHGNKNWESMGLFGFLGWR